MMACPGALALAGSILVSACNPSVVEPIPTVPTSAGSEAPTTDRVERTPPLAIESPGGTQQIEMMVGLVNLRSRYSHPVYRHVCRTPCRLDLSPGEYSFRASGLGITESLFVVDVPETGLRVRLRTRSAVAHDICAVSLLVGFVSLFVGFAASFTAGASPTASGALLVSGGSVAGASIVGIVLTEGGIESRERLRPVASRLALSIAAAPSGSGAAVMFATRF